MIFSAVVAVGLAWLLGTLTVSLLWPRIRSVRMDLSLILPLGIGLGLGLTSALYFAASLVFENPARISTVTEVLVSAVLAWCLWRRPPSSAIDARPATAWLPRTWFGLLIVTIFGQVAILAAVATARAYKAEPLGSWDGWAIWNMHARFMFRGSANWPELLRQPAIAWTHADYPLLVPASVARVWAWVGRDAPSASGLVSAMFGVATVGLLIAATARLRSRLIALIGGLLLLGTPFFVTFSSNEHADIPLGFFMLATVALLALSDREPPARGLSALAGLAAGMAAWTKNEGLLFAVVVGFTWVGYEWSRGSRWTIGAFLSGLVAALLPVIYFKISLAPPNDVVSGQLVERLGGLFDGSRHLLILDALGRDLTRFGEWRVAPFLAMLLPLIGPGWQRLSRREWLVAVVIGLMLAGYYGIYLLTPWDLGWHLSFSLVRLLLQLWPAVIFFWCLAVTLPVSPAAAASPVDDRGSRRAVVFAGLLFVNAGLAGVGLTLLGRQLAPNELSRTRIDGTEVSAIVGDGWSARETYGRTTWIWSKGKSTLWLRISGDRPPIARTLTFAMRSLGPRIVTVTIGDRIVWRGEVGEQLMPVETTRLELPPGLTAVVFSTDSPGVLESASPDARALTFAVYSVSVK